MNDIMYNMKIFDVLFRKENIKEEDYATADESYLIGEDY
jgi:hypothetical protein